MAKVKRNKVIARSIVVAGTFLAGIGIWSSIANSPQPYVATTYRPSISTEPSGRNTSAKQPADLNIGTGVPTPSVTQPAPVLPLPTPSIVQPVPVQPANTPSSSFSRQAPRLRTRGS